MVVVGLPLVKLTPPPSLPPPPPPPPPPARPAGASRYTAVAAPAQNESSFSNSPEQRVGGGGGGGGGSSAANVLAVQECRVTRMDGCADGILTPREVSTAVRAECDRRAKQLKPLAVGADDNGQTAGQLSFRLCVALLRLCVE